MAIHTPGDFGRRKTYSQPMEDGPGHLILTIETKQPIEVGNFVGQFTSLASQYEKFIRESHPDFSDDAEVFVREVKEGSIIAILIPLAISVGLAAGKVIEHMDSSLCLRTSSVATVAGSAST